MTRLDPFYAIVETAEWTRRLTACGVRLIQLRIKDRPEREIGDEIAAARAIAEETGAQLVVNDHWRLAIEEGCDFVHLGQEDLDDADPGAIRAAGLRLGVSTHDEAELERALALDPDYIALGPVYPTILKKMPWAPQGLNRLSDWRAYIGAIPLVAIGGMTIERAPGAFGAGADIVSAVTDVTLADDPDARARAWVAATESRRKAASSPLRKDR